MHKLCFAIVVVLLTLPLVISTASHLQVQIPRKNEDLSNFEQSDVSEDNFEQTIRLREGLRALLALNDGELQALLSGRPLSTIADDIAPSTDFILRANRKDLQKFIKYLQRVENRKFLEDEDMKIAKRKKVFQRLLQSEAELEDSIESDLQNFDAKADPDSLLGAITDLAIYLDRSKGRDIDLKEKARKRRSQKHKRRNRFRSHKSESIHYSYWLRSEECPPSRDGTEKLFCPSPTDSGDWVCIEDVDLCDGHSHCPNHDDEDPKACLFYKAIRNHVNLLENHLIMSRRS